MTSTLTRAGRKLALAALVVTSLAAAPPRPHPQVLGAGPSACAACHDASDTFSHPVDVYPSMAVPDHLPLEGGRMTCGTCHDLAAENAGRLRSATATGLCVACHDPISTRTTDVHALAMPRAHYRPSARRRVPGSAAGYGPDRESTTCLGCHDGALARDGRIRSGGSTRPVGAARLGGDHPIGVRQRVRGAGDHLVPAFQLDPAIRLFGGRVGCGSCHSLYAGEADLLVMSNERSQLCLSCHDF